MATHKINRKTLKQDSFMEKTAVVVEFLQEHYVKLGIGLLVLIVVVIGSTYYRQSEQQSARSASFLLYQGEDFLARGSYVSAQAALQDCVDRFGGTEFGKIARVSLAKTMIGMGENDLALSSVAGSLGAVSEGSPLYTDLLIMQATAMSNLEQYADAAGVYRSILERDILDPITYDISVRLADCLHAAGNSAEGLAILEALQQRIDNDELDLLNRNLEPRIEMFRAFSR